MKFNQALKIRYIEWETDIVPPFSPWAAAQTTDEKKEKIPCWKVCPDVNSRAPL
jgi:hypothetical protein